MVPGFKGSVLSRHYWEIQEEADVLVARESGCALGYISRIYG